MPGSFPMHDLVDLGVELPEGEYTTVAGLVLDRLGHIPRRAGDVVAFDGWTVEVVEVGPRAVSRVRIAPRRGDSESEPAP
jgi:putative hemolysin